MTRHLLLNRNPCAITSSTLQERFDHHYRLQASEQLRNIFDGLSVRISHQNQVSPESTCIDIAWDFEV